MRLIDGDYVRDEILYGDAYVSDELAVYIKRVFDDAPTIDPESLRPQGEWIHKKHKIFGNTYEYVCSVCGCDYALAEYDYCPNCGAKMKGAGEDA